MNGAHLFLYMIVSHFFYQWNESKWHVECLYWHRSGINFAASNPFILGLYGCDNWDRFLIAAAALLRVRAVFHKTVRVCHVYCNFKIGFTCRITVIFGSLKDGSHLINALTWNICFSYRNMFQNGVDALSKITDAFLSKSSTFHLVRIIR